MVMGHLLARLAEKIQVSISGNFKTFCIGHSLGGQLCGFAGKDYRCGSIFFEKSTIFNLIQTILEILDLLLWREYLP